MFRTWDMSQMSYSQLHSLKGSIKPLEEAISVYVQKVYLFFDWTENTFLNIKILLFSRGSSVFLFLHNKEQKCYHG